MRKGTVWCPSCFVVRLRSPLLLSRAGYPPLTGSKLMPGKMPDKVERELQGESKGEQHGTGLDTFPHPTLHRVIHRRNDMTWSGGSSVAPLVVVVPSAFLISRVMRTTKPG